jgi:hypothetical protein
MYVAQLFDIMGWALNACLRINALVQDQGKYVCEQTIENYE